MKMILFMVEYGNAHVITWAHDRDDAIRKGAAWLGGNYADRFTVTPLTAPGDRVKLDITLYV